jgi:CubicO group peptidase (beta-lactamase class C family)
MKPLYTIFFLLYFIKHGWTQNDHESIERFAQRVNEVASTGMKEFAVPGMAMAVIKDGKVLKLSMSGDRGDMAKTRIDSKTVFNIGSISKTFCAWGVLRLYERGVVALDSPAANYLKRWKFPPSKFEAQKVTVRQLLSHTAGVNIRSIPSYTAKEDVPDLVGELEGGKHAAVAITSQPGDWRYSGGGYMVLQLLIEDVSGRPFADFMREEIFQPLGMLNTSFVYSNSAATPIDINLKPTPYEYFAGLAGAGVNTTLDDMVKWVLSSLPGHRTILKEETLRLAWTNHSGQSNYGLGYFLDEIGTSSFVGHDGANAGRNALFKLLPAKGDAIVFLTNSSFGSAVYSRFVCEWMNVVAQGKKECNSDKAFEKLMIVLFGQGLPAANKLYHEMVSKNPKLTLSEGYMSYLAYQLSNKGFVEDAIALLEFDTIVNAGESNAFNSLGEICARAGKKSQAITAYEAALRLNPNDEGAQRALEKLK